MLNHDYGAVTNKCFDACLYKRISDYKKYGVVGLENKKSYVKKDLINPKFEKEVRSSNKTRLVEQADTKAQLM